MKHAVIISRPEEARGKKTVEFEQPNGEALILAEAEYSPGELARFEAEKRKWILRCSGSQTFLAEHDSGEDARGYYCGYFDPEPSRAVFDGDRLVGLYICTDGFRYSGNGRSSFSIDRWRYPGDDPFSFVSRGSKRHVFLFADEAAHKWGEWTLLEREPGKEYRSFIDF